MRQVQSVMAGIAIAGVMGLAVLALRLEGRVWWCACGRPFLYATDVNSSHNSQHLLDAYSFTHVLHGVVFFWCLWTVLRKVKVTWLLLIATVIEAGWEVLENSPMVIDRYRTATAAFGYTGDSIANSAGDILSCVLGFLLASRIGWRWSLAVFVGIELALLLAIRDNLTLNVIMLIWPVEAIKRWQMGG